MNLFKKKSGSSSPHHLTYDTLEAFCESLPPDWMKHPDMAKRDLWLEQFAELRKHLYDMHVATLTDEEQREIEAGTHPSQSHKFEERAQPFTIYLKEELARLGYNAQVKVGIYHCDRIVLSAKLDRTPSGRTRDVPWLFRGFEVKYGFPDDSPKDS